MILEVGRAGKCRFIRGIKKTNIFEHGSNGIVVEREKKEITLYATNSRCSEIYCIVPLGGNEILKKNQLVCAVYDENMMLLDGGAILAVVDFAEKKVAVNRPEIPVIGKKDWGENARMPWKPQFNAMFGLPTDELTMMPTEVESFWSWFAENEGELTEKIAQGGEDAKAMEQSIRRRLWSVFPYAKERDIEFQLTCDGDAREFTMYHLNLSRMMEDTAALGERMPEELKQRWSYTTQA